MKREFSMKSKSVDPKVLSTFREGMDYIYPQNKYLWFCCVENCYKGKYRGEDVEIALKFMKCVGQGDSVRKLYDNLNKNSNMSKECFEKTVDIVLRFSKNGVDFYAYVMGNIFARVLTCGQEKMLSKIARENQKYEEELHNGDISLAY